MDYYRLTIPIPKQPWQWIRYRIVTALLLVAIAALAMAWWSDHQYLMAELHKYQNPGPRWEAVQATGAPDSISSGDSTSAWCPATADRGEEWLILDYQNSIVPTSIELHENYKPGAVVRVTHYPKIGSEQTLWEGTYKPTAVASGHTATLNVTTPVQTNRIKVYLDTAAVSDWNEIDAVGLVDANGQTYWASGAKASSTWGDGSASTSTTQSGGITLQR